MLNMKREGYKESLEKYKTQIFENLDNPKKDLWIQTASVIESKVKEIDKELELLEDN